MEMPSVNSYNPSSYNNIYSNPDSMPFKATQPPALPPMPAPNMSGSTAPSSPFSGADIADMTNEITRNKLVPLNKEIKDLLNKENKTPQDIEKLEILVTEKVKLTEKLNKLNYRKAND